MMFAWCSNSVSRITSPALTCAAPQLVATRLIDSVVPLVKTISLGELALMNSAVRDAGGLVGGGGAVAQFVDATMDVAVVALVIMADGVDHDLRALAAGGTVQVNERFAVDLLVEDRKVAAESSPIDPGGRVLGSVVHGVERSGPKAGEAICIIFRIIPNKCDPISTAAGRSDGS